MLVLKNADVAEKYVSSFKSDPMVHVPGGKSGNGWKGRLSSIPMAAADRLIEKKSNLVELKVPAPATESKDDKVKKITGNNKNASDPGPTSTPV